MAEMITLLCLALLLVVLVYYGYRYAMFFAVVLMMGVALGNPRPWPYISGVVLGSYMPDESFIHLFVKEEGKDHATYILVPYSKTMAEKLADEKVTSGETKLQYENSLDFDDPMLWELAPPMLPLKEKELREREQEKPVRGQDA
jgi:hypothetical protein